MPKIFRVQDIHGVGMYHSEEPSVEAVRSRIYNLDNSGFLHPTPYQDSRLVTNIRKVYKTGICDFYYYGFTSKAQLKRWIYDDAVKEILSKAGLHVMELDVERRAVGDTQCVFLPDEAENVKRHSLRKI